MLAVTDLRPDAVSVALFALGWLAGWLVLWRGRDLPGGPAATRSRLSVVVPARDEVDVIGPLVRALGRQLRPGDELIVADDRSADGTGAAAAAAGARVVVPPEPPAGWAGKPHAAHHASREATGEVLVFVDADVHPGPGLLDGLAAAVRAHPDELVSVQPWHRAERAGEQLSALFNVVALMGSAGFTVLGERVPTHVAFGPVLACTREAYDAAGGHAHPDVRGAILEDIALARRFPRSRLHLGTPATTTFRMYPRGARQVVEGWTKGMGIGADATPWWALVATAAWVTSLAGGWTASPWFAAASLVQLAVLARRAGGFRWWAIAAFPLLVVAFVVVVARSVVLRRLGRTVSWKGRRLRPDQATGRPRRAG